LLRLLLRIKLLPTDDVLGYADKIVSNKTLVSFYALVISAFSCKPKASGFG